MRHINGDYARWFNAQHRRVGHLWQGRYRAILVQEANYLAECSRYIHLNPNRSRITRPAERYRWSSYRNYVGGPVVAAWVDVGRVLGFFDGDPKKYRAYVEAGRGEKPIDPFERAAAGMVLGGEGFIAGIRNRLKGRAGSAERPALRRLRRQGRPSAEDVERAVEEVFAGTAPRRKGRLLLHALRRHSSLRPIEIARSYSRTPVAVTVGTKAIEAEARRDKRLASSLLKLEVMIWGTRVVND